MAQQKADQAPNVAPITIEEGMISDEEEDYIKQTRDFDDEIRKVRQEMEAKHKEREN